MYSRFLYLSVRRASGNVWVNDEQKRQNTRLSIKLLLLALAMLGFSVAMIPLYNVFTKVSGVNGKVTQAVNENSLAYEVDAQRKIYVDFITAQGVDTPLQIRFEQTRLALNPGRVYDVSYVLQNVSDKAIKLRTVASITPGTIAKYLDVINCICFEQLSIAARETKSVVLRLAINPDVPANIKNIAFAQQFFNIK